MRDHLVRSRILLLTLIEGNLLRHGHRLLVVGAGAAGVNAAMTAAARGIHVILIERKQAPFGLQAACTTRYLNAIEYDWPRDSWHLQAYPDDLHPRLGYHWFDPSTRSSLPDYLLVHGSDSANFHAVSWSDQLDQFCKVHPNLQCRWSNELLPGYKWMPSNQWEVSIQDHGKLAAAAVQVERFDFVVTALGQGEETTVWMNQTGNPVPTKSPQFWEDDNLGSSNLGFGFAPKVLIIGLGDGALQDWWRCLVDPRLRCASDVMRRILLVSTTLRQKLPSVAARLWLGEEQALRAMQFSDTTRTPELYAVLNRQYLDEIDRLWRNSSSNDCKNAVLNVLRQDLPESLTIIGKEPGATPQRVYGLNRFLFRFLRKGIGELQLSRPALEVLEESDATLVPFANRYQLHTPSYVAPPTRDFDHVIIRTGPARAAQATGRVGIRASLGRAGVPFVAPQ